MKEINAGTMNVGGEDNGSTRKPWSKPRLSMLKAQNTLVGTTPALNEGDTAMITFYGMLITATGSATPPPTS
jgi:hypothetical protein